MSKLREEKVNGYEEYQSRMAQLKADGCQKLWVMFSGTIKDNGESWCQDCAKGNIEFMEILSAVFVYSWEGSPRKNILLR